MLILPHMQRCKTFSHRVQMEERPANRTEGIIVIKCISAVMLKKGEQDQGHSPLKAYCRFQRMPTNKCILVSIPFPPFPLSCVT